MACAPIALLNRRVLLRVTMPKVFVFAAIWLSWKSEFEICRKLSVFVTPNWPLFHDDVVQM